MKLYGFPPSPNTWQVRALAAYLGVPLDFEFVDITKGAQRAPAFLAINPSGRAPALVDGDFKLWETMAIMQYIAGKKPNALWPSDAKSRADITHWQSWTLGHWTRDACVPMIFERFVKQFLHLGPPDQAAVAKGADAYAKEATMLNGHLANHSYLVGNTLTIADFATAAPLFYAKQAQLPLEAYPHIRNWFERVSALPCWRETAPQMAAAA
jgi:glutathione S-transferase